MIRKKNNRTLESTQQENLPEGWIYAKLPDIVTNNRYSIKRGPFGSHLKKECFVKSGYKVYEQQNAINNDCELGTYYINEKKFQEMKAFEVNSGDLLISCSGTIGKITLVPKIFQKGIINQALLKISINSKIMQISFFSYLFEFLTKKAEVKSHGSGIGNLFSVKVLKEIPILLPPLNEQKRIIVKIESIFSQIDAARDSLLKIQSKLKSGPASLQALRTSILKMAFEGKLVLQDPNDEPAEMFLKRMQKDSKNSKELVFERDDLPKGWVKTTVSQICMTKSGGTPSRKMPEYFEGDIPWIKSGELNDSILHTYGEAISEKGLDNSNATVYPKNTVLLAMYGATIGKVSILGFPASTNQAICAFFHDSSILYNLYLFYFLRSIKQNFINIGFGGAQKNISQEKIKNTSIPLPPLQEQHRIVSKIESIFVKIDAKQKEMEKLEMRLNSITDTVNELKQSILKLAFEGKLVSQDPTDEPAQVLLEKIKSQKSQNT